MSLAEPLGRCRIAASELEVVEVCGLRLLLSPRSPTDHAGWTNQSSRRSLFEAYQTAPPADVVVSHAPPAGILDHVRGVGPIGCVGLLSYIARVAPSLVICGHVHRAGMVRLDDLDVVVANVAVVPHHTLEPVQGVSLFELDVRDGQRPAVRAIGHTRPLPRGES